MANPTLISLAILKANSDAGMDVYGNFVPILAECIRMTGKKIISVPEIKMELIRQSCINVPQHVIDTLLIRLRNQGLIDINNEKGTVEPNQKLIRDDSFHQTRLETIRKHEIVLQDLVGYCKEKFSKDWTIEEAEVSLLSFLEEFQLTLIQNTTDGKVIPFDVSATSTDKFFVGSYVKHLLDTYSSNISYLETVTKGFMLANAMYLPNPSLAKRKFNKTLIFFDTTFLIHALGYAGATRQIPCKELLEMLYETGAELRCFRHTLDEIRSVLENTSVLISQNRVRDASKVAIPNVEYFISISASPSDIKYYIVKLEMNLDKLRIKVVDAPDYSDHEFVIDEEGFGNLLSEKIHYRNADGNAKHRDVQSISAIFRLRKGQSFVYVEDSKAIFITNNPKLARESTNYFKEDCHLVGISPCITDHMLTNLLWLKAPLKTPDLPIKVILADCFAAIQPNPELWRAYLREINNLAQHGEITRDDYYMLRYELTAKNALMEKTLGEEGAFTQGTVKEIIENVKSHYTEGLNQELETIREQVCEHNRQELRRRELINNRASIWSKNICSVIKIIVFVALVVSNFISLLYALLSSNDNTKFLPFVIMLILLIYTTIDIRKSIFIELKLRFLEIKINKFLELLFLKVAGYDTNGINDSIKQSKTQNFKIRSV